MFTLSTQSYHTEFLCEAHCTPEDAAKRDILPKDSRSFVLAQRGAAYKPSAAVSHHNEETD